MHNWLEWTMGGFHPLPQIEQDAAIARLGAAAGLRNLWRFLVEAGMPWIEEGLRRNESVQNILGEENAGILLRAVRNGRLGGGQRLLDLIQQSDSATRKCMLEACAVEGASGDDLLRRFGGAAPGN